MLEKIKEYKELIAIIVFFLGGFIWLNNQFPSKNDLKAEVGFLDCLLNKYMTLTQLQLHGQELAKEAEDLKKKIAEMETDSGEVHLLPAMKFELKQFKSDFEHNRKKYRNNIAQIKKIMDELNRHDCRKEGK